MKRELAEQLFRGAEILDIYIDEEMLAKFSLYLEELLAWNTKINLMGNVADIDIITKHFLDSLSVLKVLKQKIPLEQRFSLIDIGTGAGFPGIPMKIAWDNMELTLADSSGKKTEFLRHILKKIGVPAKVISERAEIMAAMPDYCGRFDVVTARAVASPERLIKILSGLLKDTGILVLPVSKKTVSETGSNQKYAVYDVPEELLPGRSVIIMRKADIV